MHRGGARLAGDCLLEIVGRAGEVATCERCPARAVQRRGRPWIPGQRLREERRRGVWTALGNPHFPQPDQRGEVVGPQPQHLLERFAGLLQRAADAIDMAEVIRPARIGRSKRLRVEEARLGPFEIGRRHQELARFAVFAREILVRRPARQRRLQRALARLHLLARRAFHRGDVGKRHRPQAAAGIRERRLLPRTASRQHQ